MSFQKVVTVRMPPKLHEVLMEQSRQEQKSLNELCIERLLYGTDLRLVKTEASVRVEPIAAEVSP